jgi:hypothetical protein
MDAVRFETVREMCNQLWNPIGVPMRFGEHAGDRRYMPVDEYDRYLWHLIGMLEEGGSIDQACKYLEWAESEYMGLSSPAGDKRAFVSALTHFLRSGGN